MRAETDPEEIADIDPSPEDVENWKASLPPEVRAEIEKEADKDATEMIHKFEMHALDYEKEHPETAPKKDETQPASH